MLNPKGETITALNKHVAEIRKTDEKDGIVRLSMPVASGKYNDVSDLNKAMNGFHKLGIYVIRLKTNKMCTLTTFLTKRFVIIKNAKA